MTDEQIFKKAIEKANENGWRYPHPMYTPSLIKKYLEYPCYLLFNHDFAKAFWGEKDYWYETKCTCSGSWNVGLDQHIQVHSDGCARPEAERGFKFHLQQMVLEEEPLKYLEQFLEVKND